MVQLQSPNGTQNGGVDPQILALIAQYDPKALHQRITTRETVIQPMWNRMDGDYNLWSLAPFPGIDESLYDSSEYLHATDNAPRTFANKITNWYNNATPIIRIEMEGRDEQLRRIDSAKERLAYGMLAGADRLANKRGLVPIREQSSYQICVRGPVFGPALLRIDPRTGQTIVDIKVWDSRSVVWDSGPDGIAWVAHKMIKTRAQIRKEYPGAQIDESNFNFDNNDQTGITVFDFWDDIVNTVFTQDMKILKPPQPHLRPRMPIAYAFGGYAPLLNNTTGSSTGNVTAQTIKDFSESIYESDREAYKNNNYLLSVGLDLAAKARDPSKKIFSPDGTLTINEDFNLPGSETSLRTDQEDIVPYPPTELTNTAAQMLALFQSQVQQGSLSPIHFGNAPFSLSGFAINSLSVSAEEKIQPRIQQGDRFYFMMLDILMEQYSTGMFPTMTVTASDRSGQGFSEAIPPQVVLIGGELNVEFVANLPSDELTKIQTAQQLRQPGVNGMPMVDDKYIRDKILAIRDGDNMEDRLRSQLAERGSPLAAMWSNIQAARNEGDKELDFLYQQEMLYLMFQMWAATQGLLPPPQIPPNKPPEFGSPAANTLQQNPSGPSAGVPPEANPPQAIGIQNAPSQQAGPNVPAGTPRPGAQANPAQGG